MLLFDEPIVAPPAPQKVFPIVWIRNLQIQAHDPTGEGKLYLEIVPMSADRELLYSGTIEIKSDTLYQAMQSVPELAQAFAAILAAVKPTKAWIDAQKPEESSDPT